MGYTDKKYVCVCASGFTGENCETGCKIQSVSHYLTKIVPTFSFKNIIHIVEFLSIKLKISV